MKSLLINKLQIMCASHNKNSTKYFKVSFEVVVYGAIWRWCRKSPVAPTTALDFNADDESAKRDFAARKW